ncbi:MAG: hypothetical protein ABIN99_02265 [Nitrosospira sp.]
MLKNKKLDDLSRLLEEMTQLKIGDPILAKLTLIMRGLAIYFLFVLLPSVFALFWRYLERQQLGTTPPGFHNTQLVVDWLIAVYLIISILILIVSISYITWYNKRLAPYTLPSLEYILRRDAEFITRLLMFDKVTLAYALLQYRHRWSTAEACAAAFVGDLRKLGLIPALAALIALLISATTLLKEDSNPFVWGGVVTIVAIFVIYNVMAFAAFLSRQRPQQVIQLLEHAIQHADQCNATPIGCQSIGPVNTI